jgi:putative ABC transport system permease protein
METLITDLRYGLRSLLKRPAVFAVSTLSLALGIAANTTIFAAVDAYLIRPLPYPEPDRIIQVWTSNPARGWRQITISGPDFRDWRTEARTVEVAAYSGLSYNMLAGDRAERVLGLRVSSNLLQVIGVPPIIGRGFLPDEDREGAPNVVVLSHSFWERRFGADAKVVGSNIMLDGASYAVVGIAPEGFAFPDRSVDFWTPLQIKSTDARSNRYLEVVGRLRSGSSMARATAELHAIAVRQGTTYPENAGNDVFVQSLSDALYSDTFHRGATLSTFAVIFVLLIACANVANLLLARASGRARELALRTALGAERKRLVRQLLTESVVLALLGGGLGTLLSIGGIRALVSIIPADFVGTDRIALNGRALLFTLVVSITAGVVFGILPALQATRANINNALREGGRSGTMGVRRNRLGASLVVAELSLALVLLISAGLLIKGTIRMQRVDLGFDPANLLTFRVSLPTSQYADSVAVIRAEEDIVRRLREIPGVVSAAATTSLPMQGGSGTTYSIEGEPKPEPGKESVVQFRAATPDYFSAMKISIQRGRAFTPQDRVGSTRVLLVNEVFANKHWPKADPIGKRVVFSSGSWEIVGVVHDSRDFGPDDEPPRMVYFPVMQRYYRGLTYVVRTSAEPSTLTAAVREAVSGVDRTLPTYSVRTMTSVIDQELQGDKIMPRLLGVFGAIALLLAVIGVYGVMSYSVSQRTQEVGIRIALGAQRGDILGMILRQGGLISLIGLVLGLGLAAASTRTLSAFLLGVSAFDMEVFAGVTLTLAVAALVATWLPARKAVSVDPLVALRAE